MAGNTQDLNKHAAENDAKTSAATKAASKDTIKKNVIVTPVPEKPPVYIDVKLTDEILHEFLCHGIFMLIREQMSDLKSVVFTPDCQVAESSDGTLIIHNDFSKAKSRVIEGDNVASWDYKYISKNKVTE